eukprot:TRINITY_DN0_c371_g1_i3.p1 TRINITY_DN0_c371_g1~~TRINITY_DN0_c371_g1_i3.p1  ORF type:complete len:111 (-),score=20.44 TRINITY_DN0_c371_g1_i3:31-363(-)
MVKLAPEKLESSQRYVCAQCKVDIALESALLSKDLLGKTGEAYMFSEVVNVEYGPSSERVLLTGTHEVRDCCCAYCQQVLGWNYLKASKPSQKFKEGKVVLELAYITKIE